MGGINYEIVAKRILNILKGQGFLKMERLAEAKFGKTISVLYVVNSIHRVEINCIGLIFLMQNQLK